MTDWKDRLNIVYSTNSDFEYEVDLINEADTLPNEKQSLRIALDKKNRKGKEVTLITGFVGKELDLKELGRFLKTKCGVGGSVKDGEIVIQGDFRAKIGELLSKEKYRVKVIK